MLTALLTIAGFAVAMVGMAAGVILGGRALRGSCGGVASECMCSPADARRCARRSSLGQPLPGATE